MQWNTKNLVLITDIYKLIKILALKEPNIWDVQTG